MAAVMRTQDLRCPCCGNSYTLEPIITIGKYISFYSTIYILCRVAACGVVGGKGGNDRRGKSEVVSADVPIVLGVDLKKLNGRLAERVWAPVNVSCPSL